jgi:hypothetical protein
VDGQTSANEGVGLDHRDGDIVVAEQFLDGAKVVARFEHYGQGAIPARSSEVVDPECGFFERALVQKAKRADCLQVGGLACAVHQHWSKNCLISLTPSSRGWRL